MYIKESKWSTIWNKGSTTYQNFHNVLAAPFFESPSNSRMRSPTLENQHARSVQVVTLISREWDMLVVWRRDVLSVANFLFPAPTELFCFQLAARSMDAHARHTNTGPLTRVVTERWTYVRPGLRRKSRPRLVT